MYRGTYKSPKGIQYTIIYERTSLFKRIDVYLKRNESRINVMNTQFAEGSFIDDYKSKFRFKDQTVIKELLEILEAPYKQTSMTSVDNGTVFEYEFDNTFKEERHDSSGTISVISIKGRNFNIELNYVPNISLENTAPLNISIYSEETEAVRLMDSKDGAIHSLQYLLALFPGIRNFEKRDYVVVKSMDDYYSRLEMIQKSDVQFVGLDTETSGLGVNYMQNDLMSGIILSNGVGNSTYYPFRQDMFKFNLDEKYIRQILDIVNSLKKEVTVLAHNGVMEYKSFYKDTGKLIRIDKDSMMEALIVDPRSIVKHDLKTIEESIDGFQYLELSDIFKRKKDINFRIVPEYVAFYYALPDGDGTIKAHLKFEELLHKNQNFLVQLDSRGQGNKFWNEYYGLRLDMDYLNEYYKKRKNQETYLKELFHNLVGDRRSITSPIAIRDIMYRKLGVEVKLTTNTGLPATNKTAILTAIKDGTIDEDNPKLKDIKCMGETLIQKRELNNLYYPLVVYQKYKEINKDVIGLERMLKKQVNGRLAFNIKQIGTESSRQSGDAQQYDTPKKQAIKSDSEHHNLFSVDYKQIEYRVFAMIAKEFRMLKYGTDPNADYHRISASYIYHKTIDNISAKERKACKSRNFGIIYGMKGPGLAKSLKKGLKPTQEEIDAASQDIVNFWTTFTEFNKERIREENEIKTKGYAETLFHWIRPDDRILRPDITTSMKNSIIRKLSNTYIQGFAATLLKLAESRIQKWIYGRKWDELVECDGEMLPKVRMMLSIHDEILLSAHEMIPVEEILEMCRYAFEMDNLIDTGEYKCKLYAAPALVNNWADGKSDAYEIPITFRDELISNYKKTGISKINKANWLSEIQEYRNREVAEWFAKIIKKSNNFDELVSNVNHPTLTHTLISLCVDGDTQNKLEHQLVKRLAAYKYLLGLDSKDKLDINDIDGNIDIKTQLKSNYKIDTVKDSSIDEDFYSESLDEDIEKDETEEKDEYEDMDVQYVGENNTFYGKEDVEYIKLYTADECMFNFTDAETEDKLRSICKDSDKQGYMKTYITKNNQVEFLGFADKVELDKF